MSKRLVAFTTAAILIAAGIGGARAQSFYEGKTISLVVGFAPGGGFDANARVLSRVTWAAGTFPAIRRSSSRT